MPDTLLMVADSERDADMLYATGLFVGDAFIYLNFGRQPVIVMNDLEIDRAKRQAPHCRVVSFNAYQQKLRRSGVKFPALSTSSANFCVNGKSKRVTVPDSFSLGLARELKALGIKVHPCNGHFFPEREIKTADEVKKISAALMMAEVGMAEGIQVLRNSKIGRGRKLLWRNLPLTTEKLRAVIDCAILQASGLAAHTIVAGGKQGCDPHERGYGPLHANEPIILDIFPRSQKTGYFGDITRTVVRGKASEAVRKLYDTVFTDRKSVCKKYAPGFPRLKFMSAFCNFSINAAITLASVMDTWKDSFTEPAMAWGSKSTKPRAWVRPLAVN